MPASLKQHNAVFIEQYRSGATPAKKIGLL
jgi:hypothetical protein